MPCIRHWNWVERCCRFIKLPFGSLANFTVFNQVINISVDSLPIIPSHNFVHSFIPSEVASLNIVIITGHQNFVFCLSVRNYLPKTWASVMQHSRDYFKFFCSLSYYCFFCFGRSNRVAFIREVLVYFVISSMFIVFTLSLAG